MTNRSASSVPRVDEVASSGYFHSMRSVDLKVLKNKLSEYVRLAAGGETRRFWRALEPFPTPVRTLDALRLAAIEFLRSRRQTVELFSYDERLVAAAHALRIPLYEA